MNAWRLFRVLIVTVAHIGHSWARAGQPPTANGRRINTVRSNSELNSARPLVPINPRCRSVDLCDISEAHDINYPVEAIAAGIRRLQMTSKQVSLDRGAGSIQHQPLTVSTARRFASAASAAAHGFDADEHQMCDSREITITPAAGNTLERKWRYIVNGDEYQQVIRAHVCSAPNKPCDPVGELPLGLSSVCRQTYMERQLMALDPASRKPVMDTFRIPSACVCYIREKAS